MKALLKSLFRIYMGVIQHGRIPRAKSCRSVHVQQPGKLALPCNAHLILQFPDGLPVHCGRCQGFRPGLHGPKRTDLFVGIIAHPEAAVRMKSALS